MNAESLSRINDAIKNKSRVLDLSNLGLTHLDLPTDKLWNLLVLKLNNNHLENLPNELCKLNTLNTLHISNNHLLAIPDSYCKLYSLTNLDLSQNNITDLPKNFGLLTNLLVLSLDLNEFSTLPKSIFNLKKIRKLYLDQNELEDLPGAIKNLKELTELSLNSNKLTFLPEEIGYLTRLYNLSLNNNLLTSLPHSIGNLSELNELSVANNQLENLPDSIGRLSNLQNINLFSNKLECLPEHIGAMRRLGVINISNNNLNSLPNSFCMLTDCRDLHLDNNLLSSLPEDIGQLSYLYSLYLNENKLKSLPESIGLMKGLYMLDLDDNELSNLPESIGQMDGLYTLSINNNQLVRLPESFGNLKSISILNLHSNKLTYLPKNFKDLSSLSIIRITNNNFEQLPFEPDHSSILLDYRGNPFIDKALDRSRRFTTIWPDAPFHLRELLKIYFSGFSVFFNEKTKQHIEFNVTNDISSLKFEIIPNTDADPETVESLLNEYYEILKIKLKEGATNGSVYPRSSQDSATYFAQIQAITFAQNVTNIKLSLSGHISDHDVFIKVSGSLEAMEDEFRSVLHISNQQNRHLQDAQTSIARLEGTSVAQNDELTYRREEAKIRASTPTNISVNQKVVLNQEIGNEFDNLRAMLYPFLKDYQRAEGADLQKEIDKVSEKTDLTPEEKTTLGKRITRWVKGVKAAVSTAKEAGEVSADISQSWGKLKDFAQDVLNDPQLGDVIESIKQTAENL